MCLLVVWHRVDPDAPLVIAANRDELVARPTTAMTVLRPSEPRILGGRDELAGGTWLAVNEHGVVAGLTNLPLSRDPARRSRGELPLIAARHGDARAAVAALGALRASEFNPCWLLVGDRDSLHYVDFTAGDAVVARELEPGLHVLENRPVDAASPKVEHVRRTATAVSQSRRGEWIEILRGVLADHEVPAGVASDPRDRARPVETEAACVHAGFYGTRSSQMIVVPPTGAPPRIWFSDGPPCTSPIADATRLWVDSRLL